MNQIYAPNKNISFGIFKNASLAVALSLTVMNSFSQEANIPAPISVKFTNTNNPHRQTSIKANAEPVSLSSFAAQLTSDNRKASLQWATEQEINASHFVIQRSVDGRNYDDVAIIFTQEGNSHSLRQYHYADNISAVNSSMFYYRLKMVDTDGKSKLSAIEVIKSEKTEQVSAIAVFPNTSQSELRITIPDSWQGKAISYNILNVHGSLLKQKMTSNAAHTELLNIADLPIGIYVINVINGNETSTKKIVKLNS